MVSMANPKTGLWSAIGALVGGLAGATTARYIAVTRPRYRYSYNEAPPAPAPERRRGSPIGPEVEDAMVIGGAAGAMLGAFVGGAVAGEEEPPVQYPPPQFPR
jgi:hypothetical protein